MEGRLRCLSVPCSCVTFDSRKIWEQTQVVLNAASLPFHSRRRLSIQCRSASDCLPGAAASLTRGSDTPGLKVERLSCFGCSRLLALMTGYPPKATTKRSVCSTSTVSSAKDRSPARPQFTSVQALQAFRHFFILSFARTAVQGNRLPVLETDACRRGAYSRRTSAWFTQPPHSNWRTACIVEPLAIFLAVTPRSKGGTLIHQILATRPRPVHLSDEHV